MAEDYELLRYITIGQYLPGRTVVHRLDPAVKLLAATVLILTIAFLGRYVSNVLALAVSVGALALAGIPLGYALSGLRPAVWIIVALLLLELLFSPLKGTVLWHDGYLHLTTYSLRLTTTSLLRLVDFVLLISAFTLTTRLNDVTRALERLTQPLQVLKVPTRELALILTIALRFVPTFALEMERLMKAQASRGGGLTKAPKWNPVAQARARLPLILPLFLIALRRAEDLVVAMESRGYVPHRERTHYRQYQIRREDWVALAVVLAVCALLVLIP
jgi:energy-coupling factor transport system permease protein